MSCFFRSFLDNPNSLAKSLYNKIRILCWIMTQPANYESKARHVKATWGQRCNKLLFVSSTFNAELPTINIHVREGRDFLWGKTQAAFKYIYKYHYNDADWFLKADDDTYVILENLRYFLRDKNSSDPVYYGCKFKPYVKQGYMSGGKRTISSFHR